MRVRGLKFRTTSVITVIIVAPHAGAWIEISVTTTYFPLPYCRTPCGCVD